jgi:hypothetical protein
MILVEYGGIWWDLVGYGGIWWDLVVGSFDSTRSRKLVGSVVESFDSTNFPKFPRVAVWWWKSVESTKFYCRSVKEMFFQRGKASYNAVLGKYRLEKKEKQ